MNPLYPVISDLLFQHDAVTLPGLGQFRCHSEGAKVNVITNQFERPVVTVSFDAESKDSDDLIVNYLCENNHLSKAEAERELETFLADLHLRLQEEGEVNIPEVGALKLRPDGDLLFTPDEVLQSAGDAFGLGDFTPTPVCATEQQDDWKKRLAEQQRDKNTKMTVDKDVMYVENEEELAEMRRRRKRKVRRTILCSLLGLLVVLACLAWLKIIDLGFIKKYFFGPQEPPVVEKVEFHPNPELLAEMVSYYPPPTPKVDSTTAEVDTVAIVETVPSKDSMEGASESGVSGTESGVSGTESSITEIVPGNVPETSPTSGWDQSYAPPATAKYFIVGGFFSEKQNALNHARSLFEQGYPHAFIYPAGSKYYTCYGHYETKEEAKQALAEINANVNPKAWLYERKR